MRPMDNFDRAENDINMIKSESQMHDAEISTYPYREKSEKDLCSAGRVSFAESSLSTPL